ncbi:sulfatase-like hydrolase/transferase [Wenyingzhuangia sp. IMCC45467]
MRALFFLVFSIISTTVFAQQPNIIFFIIDDFGYSDSGCYGSTFYETPAIDQLAADGIRFTNAYEAAPRCVESRKSIMSGQYAYRPELSNLTASHYTWAEALNDAGYATFFTGKWHLAHQADEMPEAQGFGTNIAGSEFGSPPTYWFPYKNDTEGQLPHIGTTRFDGTNDTDTPRSGDDEEYLTDRLTLETNKWIGDHVAANPTQPFVAMVSHYGVHTPIEGKAAYESKYADKNAVNNYPVDASVNELTGKTKLYQDNVTYASMIQSIDESLRDIRAKLVDLGIEDNTVIILTSDNGGVSTVPISSNREMVTSNKPLKTGKGWLYEGGIRLPLIVYGPSFRHGVVEDTPVVGTDYYPTMLEIAGVSLISSQHKDGISFKDALENTGYERSEAIVWNYDFAKVGTGNPSMAAVRKGQYKLVELKYNWQYELYDVVADPGETNDISADNAAKVAELKKILFDKRSEVGASHTVTNTSFIETQQTLYEEMNAETGSDIQPGELCAAPVNGSIVRNGDFECRFDINWSLTYTNSAVAKLADGASESRNSSSGAAKVEVTTAGNLGHVRIENTLFEGNLNGKTITVSTYAKSPDAAKLKFQLKVQESSGSAKTYTGNTKFDVTSTYAKYEETFTLDEVDTDNVVLRIQCGEVQGVLYLDDVVGTYPVSVTSPGTEVVVNPGFESGYNVDWSLGASGSAVASLSNETSDVQAGSVAAKVVVTTAEATYGKVALSNTNYTGTIDGDKLTIGCYAKSADAGADFEFKIKTNLAGASTSPPFALTSTYQYFEYEFTIDSGVTEIEVQAICGKNVGTYLFDSFTSSLTSLNLSFESEVRKTLQISPIPARDYININSPYKLSEVSIYNVSGSKVYTVINNNNRINVSKLSSGIYLMKLTFENGVKLTEKIVIE